MFKKLTVLLFTWQQNCFWDDKLSWKLIWKRDFWKGNYSLVLLSVSDQTRSFTTDCELLLFMLLLIRFFVRSIFSLHRQSWCVRVAGTTRMYHPNTLLDSFSSSCTAVNFISRCQPGKILFLHLSALYFSRSSSVRTIKPANLKIGPFCTRRKVFVNYSHRHLYLEYITNGMQNYVKIWQNLSWPLSWIIDEKTLIRTFILCEPRKQFSIQSFFYKPKLRSRPSPFYFSITLRGFRALFFVVGRSE